MFNLFKKSKKEEIFVSPVSGKVIPIEKISDPMFAQKVMGDGFGVKPQSNEFYSPVSGEIVSIFPTKHAITFKTKNGLEILLHVGIDTVELNGEPFEISVEEGQVIEAGDKLGTVNREMLRDADKDDTLIVIITNKPEVEEFRKISETKVNNGDEISKILL